jgi:hypothetical protein
MEERQRLEVEHRLHCLGRLWLLFHGPAALLLLGAIVLHIWHSIEMGGF